MAPLHSGESGYGPATLVFLHCFGGSGKAWAQVAELLGESWRCVMPDLRVLAIQTRYLTITPWHTQQMTCWHLLKAWGLIATHWSPIRWVEKLRWRLRPGNRPA